MIMSGIVYVNGQKEDKAGSTFDEKAAETVQVRGTTLRYVSRGGLKLEKAMQRFDLDSDGKGVHGRGGFHGRFHGLHASERSGEGLLHRRGPGAARPGSCAMTPWVVCMEKTNMRYVKPEDIGEPADSTSIDVSFTSLTKILLPVKQCLREGGEVGLPYQTAVCRPARTKVGKRVWFVIRRYTRK